MGITINQRPAIDKLVEMSNRYGRDPRYVLAGGGNSSWKDENEMYVKASGFSLAAIAANGFVGMDRKKLDVMMVKQYKSDDAGREAEVLSDIMDSRLPGFDILRPSVETPLHNLFSYAYVLHLHPAIVNGMTCGRRGEEEAVHIFGDSVVWINECKPGYELSKYCGRMIGEYESRRGEPPHVVFLQNHGVFVAAGSVEEIDNIYADIMGKLAEHTSVKPACDGAAFRVSGLQCDEVSVVSGLPDSVAPKAFGLPDGARLIAAKLMALKNTNAEQPYIYFFNNSDVTCFLESKESFIPLNGAFTPDHIVYCKAHFLFLDGQDAAACAATLPAQFAGFVAERGYEPRVICARGIGAFIFTGGAAEADNALALFEDAVKVAVYSQNFGGPRHLSAELTDFITDWEIEAYRQKVARGQQ
jgi:rhamnose utilization protein RhaD (predicted bifunctional aldolase and dehydrogenase)